MAFIVQSNFNSNIQSLFESDSHRYIRNVNAYLVSGSTRLTADAATLEVIDSTGVQQYFLTTVSTPAILVSSSVYFVDSIQVDAFPAGDISLIWSLTSGSTDLVLTSSISFDLAPAITIVQGQTQTIQDFKATLNQAKVFNVKLKDPLGNAVDGTQATLVLYDAINGSIVESVTGSLQGVGSGLWQCTHTLSANAYSAALDRYEAYWLADDLEVIGSRQRLEVYEPPSQVSAAPITYSSNEDLRKSIVGLQSLIANQVREPGEIEIILNQKRYLCSLEIHRMLQKQRSANDSQDLLKSLEIHMVWRSVTVDSMAFAKQAAVNGLLQEIDKQINRIKSHIFGSFSVVTIRRG